MMLHGKTAVITGANRGIGRAVLETFARHGCSVFACARAMEPDTLLAFEALQSTQCATVTPVQLDLANEESIRAAMRTIVGKAERIDILVNNAGIASGGLFQMTTLAEIRKVFEVNFFGQLLLTQGIARKMTRQKYGSIINIASTAAMIADTGTLAYGTSKAALIRATQSLATELGVFDIRVNGIAPGVTRTDMSEQMNETARKSLIGRAALKRAAEPQDVANTALFLASDLSSFVTGQVIRVDGGVV